MRLKKLCENKSKILIVSLPANSLELAKAAEAAGADALKIHINIVHRASGKEFKSWQEEKENIFKILSSIKIPIGIVPGAGKVIATLEELKEMEKLGIDFYDIYLEDHPACWFQHNTSITRMVALSSSLKDIDLLPLFSYWGIEVVEASCVEHNRYGDRLKASDLLMYHQIVQFTPLPVIVPTQLHILPEELPVLFKTGIKGIMIGAIVTGEDTDNFYEKVSGFAKVLKE